MHCTELFWVLLLIGGVDTEGIYYQSIAGMNADMSGARSQSALGGLSEPSMASISPSQPDSTRSHTAAASTKQHFSHAEDADDISDSTDNDPDDESRVPRAATCSLEQSDTAAELQKLAASGPAAETCTASSHHSCISDERAPVSDSGGMPDSHR